jgi:tetratricopeptide (TPR) repeat protein
MKFRILSACALACTLALGVSAQEAAKQAEVKVSGGERDAAQKVEKAKGTEARLQAAAAFVKKYPQSSLRKAMAEALAGEVSGTADPQQSLALAQVYVDIFDLPEEKQRVTATLLNAYINTGQVEDAMKLGSGWLAQHPDDIPTMQNLTILASSQAIKGNTAYMAQGRQYGAKAIEMLEADKMPEGFDAAKWPDFKKSALVSLYRETGVLAYKAGEKSSSLALLEKAAALNSTDPGVYFLVSELNNDEYELRAKEYQVASAAERPAALQRVETQLDKVIDSYARAIAVTEGNAQYQQANAAFKQDLERYYKFRHKNSTDGMQQLIDKYKRPAQ